MKNMPKENTTHPKSTVIGFYGYSNSGKTTLIERLIADLKKKDLKIAAIKVSGHDIRLDEPGKDSWRYAQAGAGTVVISALKETGFMLTTALGLEKILEAVELLQGPDVIIVEGAKDDFVRKIRLGEIEERANTIWQYDGDYDQLIKIVLNEMEKE